MYDNKQSYNSITMSKGYVLTDQDRYARSAMTNKLGDKVTAERVEGEQTYEFTTVNQYINFKPITTPLNPVTDDIRLYHKTTGAGSKLYVLNDAGVEQELLTSAAFSLDAAYNNGSTIDVDTTDVSWRLTGALNFKVTNSTEATIYLQTNSTQTTVAKLNINSAYILPTADGAANTILTTDGAGNVDFDTIDNLGDTTYLRLDGTNNPVASLASTATITVGTFLNLTKTTDTITVGGAITPTSSYVEIDTNGGGAADDLDTITGGTSGDILILKSANNARVPTIKHGTGNIHLNGAADFVLDNVFDRIMLQKEGTEWLQISSSNNG